ncbi:Ndufb11, NADH dehydrogenase 1 beta subcomplex subunit [Athelia psychrophila]|uniref:NADH dehydrogenase [ubiquinone] 1 beta subcomplex subunit 11, mitochondrial n=1 Tax=Athelia psychrophila TaxID=1759441 RepID=A0A166U372_9AGAM|nr:Ndufb11, NADH dehydrogenase 1 beta subcomplex subunit [Fibularhizoctonia sp. CBS 109695]
MASVATIRGLRAKAPRCVLGRRYASHGAPPPNEPSGWIFGEKPPPPGQKRTREDWEIIWYSGMFGAMATAGVLHYYKPDTTIQTWALAEAKARMEARGEDYKYKPST